MASSIAERLRKKLQEKRTAPPPEVPNREYELSDCFLTDKKRDYATDVHYLRAIVANCMTFSAMFMKHNDKGVSTTAITIAYVYTLCSKFSNKFVTMCGYYPNKNNVRTYFVMVCNLLGVPRISINNEEFVLLDEDHEFYQHFQFNVCNVVPDGDNTNPVIKAYAKILEYDTKYGLLGYIFSPLNGSTDVVPVKPFIGRPPLAYLAIASLCYGSRHPHPPVIKDVEFWATNALSEMRHINGRPIPVSYDVEDTNLGMLQWMTDMKKLQSSQVLEKPPSTLAPKKKKKKKPKKKPEPELTPEPESEPNHCDRVVAQAVVVSTGVSDEVKKEEAVIRFRYNHIEFEIWWEGDRLHWCAYLIGGVILVYHDNHVFTLINGVKTVCGHLTDDGVFTPLFAGCGFLIPGAVFGKPSDFSLYEMPVPMIIG